jgi:hypothetical protein
MTFLSPLEIKRGELENPLFIDDVPYKWRFVAGNIIYKWWLFQLATFDYQKVLDIAICSESSISLVCHSAVVL